MKTRLCPRALSLAGLLAVLSLDPITPRAQAQIAPAATDPATKEEPTAAQPQRKTPNAGAPTANDKKSAEIDVIQLSPFEIPEAADDRWNASSTLSATAPTKSSSRFP